MTDLISRDDAIGVVYRKYPYNAEQNKCDEMVDALKALPSADAVSREECDECKTDKEGVLLQQLAELQGDYETMKNAYEDALADAEWIPCSERLPKAEDMYQPPEQRYLCQLEAHGVRMFCVLSRLKGAVSPFWDWYGVAVYDSDVTAWMPLPKPYREDGEDE